MRLAILAQIPDELIELFVKHIREFEKFDPADRVHLDIMADQTDLSAHELMEMMKRDPKFKYFEMIKHKLGKHDQ